MTDLIKQVGGIDKAKQIISSAPDDYGVYYHEEIGYLSNLAEVGTSTNLAINCTINEKPATLHSCFTTIESFVNFDGVFNVDDLRQAIADYNTDHCSDIINHVSPSTQVYDK